MVLVHDATGLRGRALALEAAVRGLEGANATLRVLIDGRGAAGTVGPMTGTLPAGVQVVLERVDDFAARTRAAEDRLRTAEDAVWSIVRATAEAGAGTVARLTVALGLATPFGGAAGLLPAVAVLAAGGAALRAMRNTPQFAAVVRVGVEFADDLVFGAVGLPVPAPLRGDERALLDAVHDGAVAIGALTVGGLVVTAHDRRPLGGGPPDMADIVGSIPDAEDGGPQVSVTTYTRPDGGIIRLVSVTGTSNQGFGSSRQPFDHVGNLAAYGRNEGESISAVLLALDAAGIRPGDEIVLAGYSQGALVAQAITESGRYDVQGFVSVGGPITTTALPPDVPVVELQHPADPLVALQGLRDPDDDGSAIVTVDPYGPGRAARTDGWFDSHELGLYRESARLAPEFVDPSGPSVARIEAAFAGASATGRQFVTVGREQPRFGGEA
ncbi:hypothetical protein F8O01_16395 [Pseudoclavibacter chungangensis]|uniref:Uncharacterized protein n=1 Tax=Pseudoclavibacter chungangensis TaxID=587635 RepID=A0A7J5BME0_9MICO|nr:hypothetical protein [Pseudoclavibacter chungangensis]KAB1652613.1 hypothetical protein F8O01_16395 [Pseudoclavibacter chungangensis]NYJ68386.1 hypothetical protein [Pseudoclavibacter chungangensis]